MYIRIPEHLVKHEVNILLSVLYKWQHCFLCTFFLFYLFFFFVFPRSRVIYGITSPKVLLGLNALLRPHINRAVFWFGSIFQFAICTEMLNDQRKFYIPTKFSRNPTLTKIAILFVGRNESVIKTL